MSLHFITILALEYSILLPILHTYNFLEYAACRLLGCHPPAGLKMKRNTCIFFIIFFHFLHATEALVFFLLLIIFISSLHYSHRHGEERHHIFSPSPPPSSSSLLLSLSHRLTSLSLLFLFMSGGGCFVTVFTVPVSNREGYTVVESKESFNR